MLDQDQAAIVDPFYSPLLLKIDKILLQLGFTDEPCRERLICSMYKTPAKYSPHSNFISAELSRLVCRKLLTKNYAKKYNHIFVPSRDTSELRQPVSTNTAVIRFYRYVQAARDGQDQRDCLRTYAQCTVNTEK